MSFPRFISDQLSLGNFDVGKNTKMYDIRPTGYDIHFLTFATSNWEFAHKRYAAQLNYIEKTYAFFKSGSILSEKDLPPEWHERFQQYTQDHAYAMWAWKPFVIAQTLSRINNGDFLLYLDGGCTFPRTDSLLNFFNELALACNNMKSDGISIGTSKYPLQTQGCRSNTSLQMLSYFGLVNDSYFLDKFPHWQSGTLLIEKSSISETIVTKWNKAFDSYDKLIKRNWKSRCGEIDGFAHDGGDQSSLQAILYQSNTTVKDLTDLFYGSGVVAHIRR